MTICSQCRRENEEGFYFCSGCGANLKAQRAAEAVTGGADVAPASVRVCDACAATVPVSHLFCGACGARQRRDTAATGAVPEEAVAEPAQKARLVIINPDGSSGDSVSLSAGENVLGRHHGPPAFRDDPFLSPEHVVFRLEGGAVQVRDLDSLNGVFIRISEPTEVRHGDWVRIGRQLLRFEVLDQSESVMPADGSMTKALGAPRGDAWGRLVRVSSPGPSSQGFVLSEPEEVIGRERGTILLRDDGFVSGRHARITTSGRQFLLEDLRSSNGTFVRVRSARSVEGGDLLLIGQQPLRLVLE